MSASLKCLKIMWWIDGYEQRGRQWDIHVIKQGIESRRLVYRCSQFCCCSVCLQIFIIKCCTREKRLFEKTVHAHTIFKPFFKVPLSDESAFLYLDQFLLSHLPFSLRQPSAAQVLVLGKGMFHYHMLRTEGEIYCAVLTAYVNQRNLLSTMNTLFDYM